MQLSIQGDRSTSFSIALGLCLDLLRAKSEGPVSMEIPLGLIPRLMTKGESAWHQVKIQGSRDKFPSGVFRRCNLGNEKGPDTSTRGATSWFTKPLPSVTRSPGPKGSSAQLPTPPGISLSEPSRERPLVDTHYFSPVREALFNTLRKDVHRGQKDSVIGTQTTYALVNENHLDRIRVKQQCRNQAAPCLERIHTRPPAFPKEGEIRCLLLTVFSTYTIVKSSAYLSSFFFFYSHQILDFHQLKVKRGKEESFGIRSLLNLELSRFSMWGGIVREWRFSDKGIVPLKLARMFSINRAFTAGPV